MDNIDKKGYKPVTIRIYSKDKQLILEDEILCAFDKTSNKIYAVGKVCREHLQDNNIVVVNPMKWGVVADFAIFRRTMEHYIKQLPKPFARKTKVAICVPAKLTAVEHLTFKDSIVAYTGEPFYLVEKSFEQMIAEGMEQEMKGINYYIEFVSEYYASEYFS